MSGMSLIEIVLVAVTILFLVVMPIAIFAWSWRLASDERGESAPEEVS